MNVFRLVLCLAGLLAYLVTKQWIHSSPAPASPPNLMPSATTESNVRHTVSHSLPVAPVSSDLNRALAVGSGKNSGSGLVQ